MARTRPIYVPALRLMPRNRIGTNKFGHPISDARKVSDVLLKFSPDFF
jgi:hypothetical protein